MLLFASIAAEARKKPWGKEFTTPDLNRQVMAVVIAMSKGPEQARPLFSDVLIVGPALYTRLTKVDPTLGSFGTVTIGVNGGSSKARAMRIYKGEDIAKFLASKAVIELASKFAKGVARAASNREREGYYYTIPFECDKEPLAVSAIDGESLFVSFVDSKATWLDCLSDY
jgi:hypothetical protein